MAAEGAGGWHLAWLRATNEATGASSMLPVGRWVTAPPPPRPRSPPPGAGVEPGYRVAFLTARGCFAGTRAQARRPRPGPVAILLGAIGRRGTQTARSQCSALQAGVDTRAAPDALPVRAAPSAGAAQHERGRARLSM